MPLCPLRLDVSALDASPLPLDLTLVKDHLAVDGTDNDTLIETLMLSAIRWAEGAMRRTIYARSHVWVLKEFPSDYRQEIRLPRGKTQSVESITYRNSQTTYTLAGPSGSPGGSDWQEDLRGDDGGLLMPPQASVWPIVDFDYVAPVAIAFTAGWLAAEVPADITHALLFAVSDGFDTRGSADIAAGGTSFATRNALIGPYRLQRWFD